MCLNLTFIIFLNFKLKKDAACPLSHEGSSTVAMRHASEGGGPGSALNSAGYAEAAGCAEATKSFVVHVEVVYAIVSGG